MAHQDQAHWLAAANIVRFRDLLTSSTDNVQRKLLEELLARELKHLEQLPSDEDGQNPAYSEEKEVRSQLESPGKPMPYR